MPNDNTLVNYGGALAQLFGLPTGVPAPAPKRVPVRLPTDDEDAAKASRMVRLVDPRRAAATFKPPVPKASVTNSALADIVGRAAETFGDISWGSPEDVRKVLPRDNSTYYDPTRIFRNIAPDVIDTLFRGYQAGMGALETGAKVADDAADATGINNEGGIADRYLPGKVRPGSAGMALMEALPDFGVHSGGMGRPVPKGPLPKLGQIVADWRKVENSVDPNLPVSSPLTAAIPEVKSPGEFIDRLNKEGPDFLNTNEGATYFAKNADKIHTELNKRAPGEPVAANLDRRANDADAYFEGVDRRAQPEVTPTSAPVAQPEVSPAEPAQPPVDMTPPQGFEPTAGPVNDNVPPPLGPLADTAAGAPDSLAMPRGDVDVDLRSTEGLKALMAERGIDPEMLSRDPVTPQGEPVNPLGTANNDPNAVREAVDGNIGSRNAEAMGLTPEEADVAKFGADYAGIKPEVRSRADTVAAGDALGYTPGNIPPVGDLSAQISAGEKVVHETVDDLFKAVDETGTDSQETVDALDKFVESFGPHSQNVGETGRALNILRGDSYGPTGEKVGDAASAKIVKENLADPETRDAALAAIKAAKGNKAALQIVATKLKKKTASDFVSRVYYSAWLSDPASQSRNILGNSEKLLSDMTINGLTAVAGLPAKLSGTSNRIFGREVAASAYGAMRGALSGLANLKKAYTRGAPLDQVGREGSVGVGGKVSNILEYGPRAMAAGDEFFRSAAFMSNMYRQATRKAIIDAGEEGSLAFKKLFPDIDALVTSPDEALIKGSVDYAKEARFQGEPGFVGKGIERMLAPSLKDTVPEAVGKTVVRLGVLPFVRTPANILREAARMSPAGIASSRNWRAWRAGGPEAQAATMRVAFGTGISALVWSGVNGNTITGNGPSDYKKLAALKDTGWTPNSFKVGDKYIPYEGLGPLSVMLSGVATSAERYRAGDIDGKGFADKMASATLGIADASIHNGWMSGLADVFDALGKTSDDERGKALGDTILSQATSPLMPGLARAINQSWFDPYARETKGSNAKGFSGSMERAENRIKTVWPGLSDDLPVKKDTLGVPILNRRAGKGIGAFISPSVPVDEKTDPTTVEIGRLERGLGAKVLVPPAPTNINIPGLGSTRLNGEQYQDYQALFGASVRDTVGQLMKVQGWDKLSDVDKRSLVSEAVKDGRKLAKEQFLAGLAGAPTAGDGSKASGSTDPKAAVPADDGSNTFVGIPQSVRRTAKGNEAVGGVANSDHLKGDAVDFTPPAGMSMKELEREARAYFPGMYVLNEGTHIHVRIPGLNGPLFGKKGSAP